MNLMKARVQLRGSGWQGGSSSNVLSRADHNEGMSPEGRFVCRGSQGHTLSDELTAIQQRAKEDIEREPPYEFFTYSNLICSSLDMKKIREPNFETLITDVLGVAGTRGLEVCRLGYLHPTKLSPMILMSQVTRAGTSG